jgi:RHS repeat-associated protein
MLKKYLVTAALLYTSQVFAQQAVNYVRTWDARIPITDASTMATRPVTEVLQTTGYFDGLGRPLQTVVKQGSLNTNQGANTAGDMVSPNVYDLLGREVQKFLPYASTYTDGALKSNPLIEQGSFYSNQLSGQGENYFYSNSDVEASPLNRVIKTYAPGSSWVGSARGVTTSCRNNLQTDDVKIWSVNGTGSYALAGVYGDGQLAEQNTIDEKNSQVIEYKDKEGKVILKKVQVSGTVTDNYDSWLCTYYVYDIYNNLRLVIPPKAVAQLKQANWPTNVTATNFSTLLDELCFRYEYDDKNRMSIKKVPGAAEVYMVYDKWDRLVLTQDGNLRSSNKWGFNKYDYLGRSVMTGFYTDATNTTQAIMQTYVNSLMPSSGPATFESTNTSSIGYTTTNSFPSLGSPQLLTISFYDNYNWATNYNSTYAAMDNSNDGLFYSSGSPLYAQPLTQSNKTKGMVTGTVTYILNSTTNQKLVSSIFYDDRGRALQSKADNISGGMDITTAQYSFSGKPLMNVLLHHKTAISSAIIIITKTEYDVLGRLLQVKKQVIQAGGVQTTEKIIAKNEYDALGQMKTKTLAPQFNSNAGLEKLNYEYNVRGWLLGVNRDFVKDISTSNYFGFELGYDKQTAVVSGTIYNNPQYNGNIEGTTWKSKGDNEKRKYDFTYDYANRLLSADFNQYTSGSFNRSANVDFSVKMGDGIDYKKAYDENGNILQMQQWGLKINFSDKIDDLHYAYYANSNKLQNVIDFKNDAATKLGDFRTSANHVQAGTKAGINSDASYAASGNGVNIFDYGYNVNGNIITDRNKDLAGNVNLDQTSGGAITYNHLNLPSVITVAGRGNITYTYDAAGNKLQKKTVENNVSVTYNSTAYTVIVTTTTDYIAGFVYESKTYSNSTVNTGIGYTDKLQFTGHEEGRIRAIYNNTATPNTITGFVYDYMVKDHLGNVRMVLTDDQQIDHYPTATLEANAVTQEQTYYDINTANVVNKPTPLATEPSNLLDYLNDNGTNNPYTFGSPTAVTLKMMQLSAPNAKTGMGMVLKVMAGDKLDILAKSYYQYLGTNASNTPFNAGDIINAFLGVGGTNNAAVLHGGTYTVLNSNSSGTVAPISNLVNNSSNTNSYNNVKAGVCYLLFDEQFNLVSCQFDPVYIDAGGHGNPGSAKGGLKNHFMQGITVPKNGYLYVYCSNESNINVFFDNLEVVHTRGQILEETHYYPFGLAMAGISSKAAGNIENKRKWDAASELNTDFDINLYETFYRSLDPQIGRFWQIDPKPNEVLSPYSSMGNNPILINDPLGDTTYYYDEDGQYYGRINNKGAETIVVVDHNNDHANIMKRLHDDNFKDFQNEKDADALVKSFASYGITYDVAAAEKFYDDNKGKSKAEKVSKFPIDNMEKPTYDDNVYDKKDGKQVSTSFLKNLSSETLGNLVLVNGIVTVGSDRYESHDVGESDANNLPKNSETVGNIHNHQGNQPFSIGWKNFGSQTFTFFPSNGPSKEDKEASKANGRYGSVVVDEKYVYIVHGDQVVKHPK